jgi:hypothetical protein
MHTSTITENFLDIYNAKLKEVSYVPFRDKDVIDFTYTQVAPDCIDDSTDIPLLVKWLDDCPYKSAFEVRLGFLLYILYYLHFIKNTPKDGLINTCNLLSLDTLKYLYTYGIKVYISDTISSILHDLVVNRIKEVFYSKSKDYTIVFNNYTFDLFKDVPKFDTVSIENILSIEEFLKGKPYIFLYATVSMEPYQFFITKDDKPLFFIEVSDHIKMVTYAPEDKNLETLVLNKINICSNFPYQNLFDNLKKENFLKKNIQIYPRDEVEIVRNEPYDTLYIIQKKYRGDIYVYFSCY